MTITSLKRHKIIIILSAYAVAIAFFYSFPSESEWYSFYSYLNRQRAIPYVDLREGYPPLGFLIYLPIYILSGGDSSIFSYGFKALNGILLVATSYVLHLILKNRFGSDIALKLTGYYAALPSVIFANSYSNDIVALLPAALAIYMMGRKKPMFCGILIGLATLSKGFPILLVIPALISFKEPKSKLTILAATFLTLLLLSMPFLLLDPFIYASTFTHHGSRGPWETVWAIIEGYYSHGGFLHPYFDKFFYHFNLLRMYPANPFDHAIYRWGFSLLPSALQLSCIAVLALLSLTFSERSEEVLSLCGLLYVGNMLFFKGYSTQFAVSTQFYMLLATARMPLPFVALLELSHLLQILSWHSRAISPELLSNEHRLLLVSATLIRTALFSALVAKALVSSRHRIGDAKNLLGRALSYLGLLQSRRIVFSLFLAAMFGSASALFLTAYLNDADGFRVIFGSVEAKQFDWSSLRIYGLRTGDKVMIRLHSNAAFDVEISQDSSILEWERGIINQYSLKGSFNESLLFFVSSFDAPCEVRLRLKHPVMAFRVTDGLYGDLTFDVKSQNSTLLIRVRDLGRDGRSSLFRVVYPLQTIVDQDFSVNVDYTVIEGTLQDSMLDIFDETDEWLYSFRISENPILNSESRDIFGNSWISGDEVCLLGLVYTIADNSSATIRINHLAIAKAFPVPQLYALEEEIVNYEIFVQRDFEPSIGYVLSTTLATAFCVLSATLTLTVSKTVEVLSIGSSMRRGTSVDSGFDE
ncbi:MAG: glycosyltransferase family 87 protein [Candidatus Bathyarchaeia archaeon]